MKPSSATKPTGINPRDTLCLLGGKALSAWRTYLGITCILSGSFMFIGGGVLGQEIYGVPGWHDSYRPYAVQGILLQFWGVALIPVGIILVVAFADRAIAPRTYRMIRAGGITCFVVGLLLIAVGAILYFYNLLAPNTYCSFDLLYINTSCPYGFAAALMVLIGGTVLLPGIILLATSWRPRPIRHRRP